MSRNKMTDGILTPRRKNTPLATSYNIKTAFGIETKLKEKMKIAAINILPPRLRRQQVHR